MDLNNNREHGPGEGVVGLAGRNGKEGRNMPKAKVYINNQLIEAV